MLTDGLFSSLLKTGQPKQTNTTTRGEARGVTSAIRGFGGAFTYLLSPWALLCLFTALILNRTMVYASLRRPIRLSFVARLLINIIPITLSLWHVRDVSFALRCQTSESYLGRDISRPPGGFLGHVSRVGSWWVSDQQACQAMQMVPTVVPDGMTLAESSEEGVSPVRGSLEHLWPFYNTVCLSQFVDVFVCAVSGRHPASEIGMTLLEHSLAFAEAEHRAREKTFEIVDPTSPFGKRQIRSQKNVAPEVLYIMLISALGHLTSHTLATFDMQARFRLFSTGIWGLAFLAGFVWALVYKQGSRGVMDFPTVCVLGFIPHLLILTATLICCGVYGLALILASRFPAEDGAPHGTGHLNLQANVPESNLTLSSSEDFFTALLHVGFRCLTAASEASYLNEGQALHLPASTWLEEQRALVSNSRRMFGAVAGPAPGLVSTGVGRGPYSLERINVREVMDPRKSVSQSSTGRGRWSGAGQMLRGVGVMLITFVLDWTSRLFRPRSIANNHAQPPQHERESSISGASSPSHTSGESTPDNEYSEDPSKVYKTFLRHASGPILFPDQDDSGEFAPSDTDSGCDSDGTPAEEEAGPGSTDLVPPFSECFSPADFATLLDPQTAEARDWAQALGRHFRHPSLLTRSSYRKIPSPLEAIVDRQRRRGAPGGPTACVVCKHATRTVVLWPCRCLALCEDCRVCLAHNNYKTCICCRTTVEGFSRIFVP